jgi:hypothetical protein
MVYERTYIDGEIEMGTRHSGLSAHKFGPFIGRESTNRDLHKGMLGPLELAMTFRQRIKKVIRSTIPVLSVRIISVSSSPPKSECG